MAKTGGILSFFVSLYRDGFRNMTWGKPLVWLIFKPAMRGLTDEEKSAVVGERLTQPPHNPDTLKLITE